MTRWEKMPVPKSPKAAVDRAYTMLGDGDIRRVPT